MRVALITEKNIKKKVSQSFLKDYAGSVIVDLEKNISSKLVNFKAFILISKTILNRKNLKLKKIVGLANKNNIKLIEVAFEKSNLSDEKSQFYHLNIMADFHQNFLHLDYLNLTKLRE